AYLPLAHTYPGAPTQVSLNEALVELKPLLEDERVIKTGHNLKFDSHVLKRAGIDLKGARFDAMLESYVWHSTAVKHETPAIARKYLGLDTIDYETIAGRGAKQLSFEQIPIEGASTFAAQEA